MKSKKEKHVIGTLMKKDIYHSKLFDYNHAYKLVFQYIETFYNTVRIHSYCGYLSPNEFEQRYWKELKDLELIAV